MTSRRQIVCQQMSTRHCPGRSTAWVGASLRGDPFNHSVFIRKWVAIWGQSRHAVDCLRQQAGVRHENCIKIFSCQILLILAGV